MTRIVMFTSVLFWVLFLGNFGNVMDGQRAIGSLLRSGGQMGGHATLRIDLRLPSPDPAVVEFVLAVSGETPYAWVEGVRPSGVVEVSWPGEPVGPLSWRAVALDRAGCIVYASTVMYSPHPAPPMGKLELQLRHLEVPLCAPVPLPESRKLIAPRRDA